MLTVAAPSTCGNFLYLNFSQAVAMNFAIGNKNSIKIVKIMINFVFNINFPKLLFKSFTK